MLKTEFFQGGKTSKTIHWALSVVIVAASWFVANVVPFFEDLVSLIGALTGGALVFGLPAAFYYFGKIDPALVHPMFMLLL
jgi:hypothetical protein